MRLNYLIFPLITFLVAGIGSKWTSGGLGWYRELRLPLLAPLGWVIGIVWTIIYILTTASAIILWNLTSDKWAQWQKYYWSIWLLFPANAFLNAFWNYLFFVKHQIGWAMVEMIILELTVIALIFLAKKFSKTASILLIPYAVWVAFGLLTLIRLSFYN